MKQALFGYDPAGRLTSRTDPKGFVTSWAYDIQGRLTSKTYPNNSAVTYTYETTTSRLKSITDALGQTRQFTYANDNRLSAIAYPSAATPNVAFAYDPHFPRRTSMTDGAGTMQYTYHPPGVLGALRLSQEAGPLANSAVTYTYDALGRVAGRTVAGSGAETFQYDLIGRLTGRTNDLGAFVMSYLGQTGQIASRTRTGSTLATTWSYLQNAGDRRLAGINNTGHATGQLSNFTLTTTPENFIASITETSNTTVVYPTAGTQTVTFNNNPNQATAASNQPFTYDANGNLTSDGQRADLFHVVLSVHGWVA